MNLQSAKNDILRADRARQKIDGIVPVIENLQAGLRRDFSERVAGEYATADDIERYIREHQEEMSVEVLERAFRDNFGVTSTVPFEKTLFHYLIHRLGRRRSRIAVDYCLSLLTEHPEETGDILNYLGAVGVGEPEEERIIAFMRSPEAIYDYQLYEMTKWFYERQTYPESLLALCRNYVSDRNRPSWLRSYSLAVLGKAGTRGDLERIESSYAEATTDLERGDIVTALARLEVSRRNRFYNRVAGDCALVESAINAVRELDGVQRGSQRVV